MAYYLKFGGVRVSIGLKRGTVTVQPHRIEWDIAAQEAISRLKNILKDDVVDVQHIGSTSVKSICAKPIIDIVVGVESFDRIMIHNKELMTNGIIYRREDYLGQHLYVCGDVAKDIQTHFIHVVIWGQKAWNDYINMRNYLNSHKEKAKEYSDLKERLASAYPEDRQLYTAGKSTLIENILRSAKEWRKNSDR